MRLLKQDPGGWQYELNTREAAGLRWLVQEFPCPANRAARITRTDADPGTLERERLLNDSLAEHRTALKQRARELVGPNHLLAGAHRWRLRLTEEEREILLQVLNEIRLSSWHAMGEPENLEPPSLEAPALQQRLHGFMQLAGYFEYRILDPESEEDRGRPC